VKESKNVKAKLLVLADGASSHIPKWLQGLGQSDLFDIYLISMNPEPPAEILKDIPNVRAIYHIAPNAIAESGGNIGYLYKLPQIRRKVKEINPEFISTYYLSSYGFIGALVKGNAKLAHCVVGSDVMITPERSRIMKWITLWSLRRADFVMSVSQTMTEKLVKKFGLPAEKIITQQYGVADWVLNYPSQEKSFEMVSTRQWIANSNIDCFLKLLGAVANAPKTGVVGRVVPGSEDLGREIEQQCSSIANCEVLPFMPFEKVIDTVAKSKFLISLTSSDGAPLSVMEAMAMGTVPILSDIAPNREWVTHLENGILLPLNDFKEAALRLNVGLNLSDEQLQAMINKNRKMILERGSFTRNMRKFSERLLSIRKN
jgi:glycosyltransferase involved in cell wall biosynthesis